MSDFRKMMSDYERSELDDLLYDATHDAAGARYPSAEFGDRLASLIEDAERAMRPWAEWVRDAATRRGYYIIAKDFLKQRVMIRAALGDRVVEKSAVIGVRKRSDEGASYDQQVLWEDLTRDELQQVIRSAAIAANAARDRIAIGRLLVDLLDRTGQDSVRNALAAVGQTLDEYLIGDAA